MVNATDRIRLLGGLNFIDSADSIDPGELLSVRNYETHFTTGAYRRIKGFEVFDGQLRPHLAEYFKLDLESIAGGPFAVGETITGVLAGFDDETAIVLQYVLDEEAADDTGFMIISELTDDVDEGAAWTGGTSGATATGATGTIPDGLEDEEEHDQAQIDAEDWRRAFITTVGDDLCIGPTKGVHVHEDVIYAFRNLVGETEGSMWASSGASWVRVPLGFKVRYVEGTTLPVEGDLITGGTSGATCVVQRVVINAGMFPGNDAEGYIVTGEITGAFVVDEELRIDAVAVAMSDPTTAQEPQVLAPNGKYRFRNYNFGGHTKTQSMYGVNGVNEMFEFDEGVFTLVESGMEIDTPTHIGVHRGHVLLAFEGGSLQHSGKNAPLSFQPVRGANEIGAGDEIVGFIEEIGDMSFVFTRNQTFRLEGFVQENIQLKLHNRETGAISDTLQRIGRSIYLDDRGFSQLPTTDAFGDFASSQISMKVDPLVQSFLKNSTIEDSIVNKGLSVYRCFFENKGAISIGFSGNKVNGITAIDYGLSVTGTANGDVTNEEGKKVERLFLCDEDGWVYETDVGRNFNGLEMEAYFVTAYHFSGQPEYNKRYRRGTLYLTGNGRTTLRVSADYNYNEYAQNFERILDEAVPLGGGRYGIDLHGEFLYSRASQGDIRVPMNSHARNVSLIVHHRERNEESHVIYAMHYHISKRRLIRA